MSGDSKNEHTVAGRNGMGDDLNQFCGGKAIYIDDDQTLYISDLLNGRIVEWKQGATSGSKVAGGKSTGDGKKRLRDAEIFTYEKNTDSFIICDAGNQRVVRWPRRNGKNEQTIISHIDCSRLAMDCNGDLYISDSNKNEVKRWTIGDKNGTIVAGGNREGRSFGLRVG